MKTQQLAFIAAAILIGAAWIYAQDAQQPKAKLQPCHAHAEFEDDDGFMPPPPHHRPPPPPVMIALDVNRDGKLSAEEIANASTALAALDENHDGQLTFEELRPPAPFGFPPPPDREEGRDDDQLRPEHRHHKQPSKHARPDSE